jgi:hypothetical protein
MLLLRIGSFSTVASAVSHRDDSFGGLPLVTDKQYVAQVLRRTHKTQEDLMYLDMMPA